MPIFLNFVDFSIFSFLVYFYDISLIWHSAPGAMAAPRLLERQFARQLARQLARQPSRRLARATWPIYHKKEVSRRPSLKLS